MCGIIGYIGNKVVEKELIEGLVKLEYRGYDSAGILTNNSNGFCITKCLGSPTNLDDKLSHYENSFCGIGHTRWATHGRVNLENAHPHISRSSIWAVVHNGVIENYKELISSHMSKFTFKSETDTEIIANLLEKNQIFEQNEIKTEIDYLKILIKTCSQLIGTYALVCCNKQLPNTLFLAKNKNPLYVGVGKNETYISSDISCFYGKCEHYYELKDKEFCYCNKENVEFFNKNMEKINKKTKKVVDCNISINTESHLSFMQKEIYEIPFVLKNIIKFYKDESKFNNINLNNINKIVLIGCGTAYHSCLVGKIYFENYFSINCQCYIASEFNSAKKDIGSNTLAIFVSQSGETLDTLIAKNYCKRKKSKIVVITNVIHSSLTKNANLILPVCAGPEIAVASTKAYNAQLAVLFLLANYLKGNDKYKSALKSLKQLSKNDIVPNVKYINTILDIMLNKENIFLLGKNADYITALESCLKIKEITYINAQAYPCGELKHGYIALVDNKSVAFVFATNKSLLKKTLIACNEIKSRGATIILLTNFEINDEDRRLIDYIYKLPNTNNLLSPIVSIIPIQLLSEQLSRKLGNNPDKPRNLAKSVTVE